jgi:hypothetical protein
MTEWHKALHPNCSPLVPQITTTIIIITEKTERNWLCRLKNATEICPSPANLKLYVKEQYIPIIY